MTSREILMIEARVQDANNRIQAATRKIHNPSTGSEFFSAIGEKIKAENDREVWMKVLRSVTSPLGV